MRIRELVALLCLGFGTQTTPAAAQRSGDQARLVFTVSGAYIEGKGLWSVPQQPLEPSDIVSLNRSIKRTLSAGFSGTYYPGQNVGITADALLLGLGFEDGCQAVSVTNPNNAQVCSEIDGQSRSAAAVVVSAGGVFRVYSREFISPFARVSAGLLFSNLSSTRTDGTFGTNRTLLVIYEDDKQTRVRPAFGIGVGASVALSKAYHLRWEVRDNIVGVDRVTGPTSATFTIPPREVAYKHLFSILIGLDVILERQRGRRY
ncbi:MAG: hypothetical protein ACREMX_04420 [Gemmatimonadales bacterium]